MEVDDHLIALIDDRKKILFYGDLDPIKGLLTNQDFFLNFRNF